MLRMGWRATLDNRIRAVVFTIFIPWDECTHCRNSIPKLETNIPIMKLRGLSPNSYIHVSVSDLYIPLIGLPIPLHKNRWTNRGNI
jgi:hypothetical protein